MQRKSSKFVTSRPRTSAGVFFSAFLYLTLGNCQDHDVLAQTASTVRVNAGGPVYSSSSGSWSADTYYSSGNTYFVSGTTAISGTSDPTLYQTERWGNFSYAIPVSNGSYTVKLYFAEIYATGANQRKFNVTAEGTQILTNYDIFADAGGANKAVVKSFPVTVNDGQLNLNFISVVTNSKVSAIEVIPNNASGGFSSSLTPYPNQATASSLTVDQILANTRNTSATLTTAETATRRAVAQMYKDFGIDISLDYQNQYSNVLRNLEPTTWSSQTPQPLSGNFVQPLSIDAPFYHAIPTNSARVALPTGYFTSFQLNTVKKVGQNGDGIGFPVIISTSSDPTRRIRSEFFGNINTLKDYFDNVRNDWQTFRGATTYGDKTGIFINSTNKTQLNAYSIDPDPDGVNILSNYVPGIFPLGNLGDKGGTTASGISNLAALVRPGEATNTTTPIPHATMGPMRRVWKSRVYPAVSWDAFIDGTDPCTNPPPGPPVNTGLVPYGGVIQLDPALKFTPVSGTTNYTVSVGGQTLTLSLPAFRILQAMQTYGHYVVDYGCADFDVYTNTDEAEYGSYAGSYGVQVQIQSVLSKATLYVVTPLVKK